MTKNFALIAAAVFGLSLCAVAQNPAPAGSSNPQPAAGQSTSAKPTKKGKKPSKKPSKKVAKGAKTAPKAPTSPTPSK